jgi:hypothetical protein
MSHLFGPLDGGVADVEADGEAAGAGQGHRVVTLRRYNGKPSIYMNVCYGDDRRTAVRVVTYPAASRDENAPGGEGAGPHQLDDGRRGLAEVPRRHALLPAPAPPICRYIYQCKPSYLTRTMPDCQMSE